MPQQPPGGGPSGEAGQDWQGGTLIFAPEFIRLAYSWEPPERNYEGANLIAQVIKNAR